MMKQLFGIIIATLLLTAPAYGKPLIADLSQYKIQITSGFYGTEMILFGARQNAGDVMVIVRGPSRDYTLRKKERVGGIWVNRHNFELEDTPDYYAVAATKPLELLLSPSLAHILQLGIPGLNLAERIRKPDEQAPDTSHLPAQPNRKLLVDPIKKEMQEAFIFHQRQRGVYRTSNNAVTFMGDTLFKTTLIFPDTIPRGTYTAETYLFQDGRLVSVQTTPLVVEKSGFDAMVYDLAHDLPALYGFVAVLLAVSAGWLASAVFRRL